MSILPGNRAWLASLFEIEAYCRVMRVAILANFPLYLVPGSGVQPPKGHYATWLPQLAEAFEAVEDLELHWLTLTSALRAPKTISWRRQQFHLLPTTSSGRATRFFVPDIRAIRATLKEVQPRLVHGWGTEDVYALAALSSGFPALVSIQGLLSHYMLKNAMRPREYFQALVELFVLFRAKRLTTESAWARDRVLARKPWASVEVVEYGADYRFFRKEWRPDPSRPAAIFVGSVAPRKGIQDLVAAFRDPALADKELWVAGDGPGAWVDALKASASPNVKWLGRKGIDEVADLMQKAWCLAVPTRADTGQWFIKPPRKVLLGHETEFYAGEE